MLLGSSETIPVCGGGVRMPLRPTARAATRRSVYPLACSGPRTEPERRALTVCVPKRAAAAPWCPAPSVAGASVFGLPRCDGELVLGQWQSVMLVDLDGPRERTVGLQLIGFQ